jgi:glycerate-2-kinase
MEKRILNAADLTSHGNVAGRKAMVEILEAGLEATDPYPNTLKLFKIKGNQLFVGREEYLPAGSPNTEKEFIDLDKVDRIFVFGAGKGIQNLAKALEDLLGSRLTAGHVIDKKGHPVICQRIGVTLGAHPAPDIDCVRGCEKIVAMIRGAKLTEKDLVFTCIGNGVSSLLTMPVPGLDIGDVSEVTRVMQIRHGAPTPDLNTIRNHIDIMKGGRISRYLRPARAIHILAISPGIYQQLMYSNNWLHTLPDSSTFQDALYNIRKFDAWEEIPMSVRKFLEIADPKWETVRAAEFESWNNRIFGVMPGYPAVTPPAILAGMKKARELGFSAKMIADNLRDIEARHYGIFISAMCRTIEKSKKPFKPPVALFSTGEMVVTVGRENGIGGRNQEFALAAAPYIARSQTIVVASVDTDGTDGPGFQYAVGRPKDMPDCLAGGIVDGETMTEIKEAGIDIAGELARHNSSPVLWRLKSAVKVTMNISLIDYTVALVMG